MCNLVPRLVILIPPEVVRCVFHTCAINDYDDAILLNPNHAAAYVGRGEVNRLKGDLDRSLADLDKAVTLNPKSQVSLYQRGETLRA